MPHCILEYSNNIVDKFDKKELLLKLNNFLSEKFSIDIKNIKSRIMVREDYVVSDGSNNQSFIYLSALILSGREKKRVTKLSKDLHQFLKENFKKTISTIPCSLTVEVREMDIATYTKESFGNI